MASFWVVPYLLVCGELNGELTLFNLVVALWLAALAGAFAQEDDLTIPRRVKKWWRGSAD